ncbi:TonB-dependent siderophore receptor [Alcanivorax xiamenensis]|uniref:TonB-dependent siderophore receptor n=1 Tax=Alcanivorax xiamenensis TaxID=1177156 RepID=A0ABQ6Y959_9GAMM|nr:TonB-dependent siderophore receptor [Alcanivorax xiamenensis]KAF0806226.1 TonB-dependent siderophore receptor [Alcanivorax xiamenensis]
MRIWRSTAATRGAVMLSFAGCLGLVASAVSAQTSESSYHHQHQRVRIALPAQKLGPSLAALSRQTGIQIHYTAGVESEVGNAVNGTMSFDQVLRTLLSGSDLTYTFTESGVEVGRQGEPHRIEAVEVTADTPMEEYAWGAASMGYIATHSASGTKTDAAVLEVPQSISVVTRQEMEDRGADSVMDAVRYTAGVSTELQGIDSRVDDITIRGFDASSWSSNMYLDGLRMPKGGQWTTPQVDAYGLERVEILKGPAAVLYGQVAPGGLVNMVAKRPSFDHQNEVTVSRGSFNQTEGTFDLGATLDKDGRWLGRIVGSYNDGDSQVDETELSRTYIAPSATWFISDNTDITFLSYYQKDDGGSTYQFLPLRGLKYRTDRGYIDRDTFLGEPDWNVYDREQWAVGYDFNHRFNEVWAFRQNAKYNHVESLFKTVVSATFTNGGWKDDDGNIARRGVKGVGDLDSYAVDNQFIADFDSGAARHNLIFGVDYLHTDWTHARYGVTATISDINVFDPVYGGAAGFGDNMRTQSDYDVSERQTGLYLQDLISIGNWHFTAGLRQDFYDNTTYDKASANNDNSDDTDDHALTWRIGGVYEFENGLAPYASYATSFEPMAGVASNDKAFDPSEGKQYEIGVKYQPPRSNSLVTLSAFDLRQTNLTAGDLNPPDGASCIDNTDPANPDISGCQRQTGETRTRGVELEAKMWQRQGASVTASYTLLDTEVDDSDADVDGNEKTYTPHNMASLWVDYKWRQGLLAGLGIGVGARYMDRVYGDAENLYSVDSYTLYDASIRYDMGAIGWRGVELALIGRNLKDEEFLSYCNSFGCSYGSARNITASVKYRW